MKNKEYRNIVLIGSAVVLLWVMCGSFLFGIKAGILNLLPGAGLLVIFVIYTEQRYRQIENLNDYLVKVLAGAEVPKIDGQEEGELSILRTNIYKVATALQYQNEQLSDDKKMLASAMADISHQLKTPLTSMMVMNDLLIDENDGPKREEFLRTQSSQLDRMNWLIQTLLKLSKLDAGTIVLKREEVSVSELIEESVKPFEIQFELKNILYCPDISEGIVRCDRNWTVEAIQNILKNCIEHMENGGKLSVVTEDTNIYSQISIIDTGSGISAEDLPHIFERFYKGKNAGKDSVGIGLALSKSILESEHGEILVESTEGAGTVFHVRIYKTTV